MNNAMPLSHTVTWTLTIASIELIPRQCQ